FLDDARACARRIAAEHVAWGECFAALLASGVLVREGRTERAVVELERAEARATATGMLLHRAVARYRRGELVGGDTGRALREEALGFMAGERIQNPARMLAMLSPGASGAR
ncbi:MAG TPA: hypothetical protein VMI54_17795, partial [Polyangiaceae bacterium]|nr:hypothetical protein [Polyangiaceae bacterium]